MFWDAEVCKRVKNFKVVPLFLACTQTCAQPGWSGAHGGGALQCAAAPQVKCPIQWARPLERTIDLRSSHEGRVIVLHMWRHCNALQYYT